MSSPTGRHLSLNLLFPDIHIFSPQILQLLKLFSPHVQELVQQPTEMTSLCAHPNKKDLAIAGQVLVYLVGAVGIEPTTTAV